MSPETWSEEKEDGELRSMSADEHLRVPYVVEMWAAPGEKGEWVRHAELPELPGCVVEAPTAREAMDQLEEMRVMYILDRLARGEAVPVPRPPLRA